MAEVEDSQHQEMPSQVEDLSQKLDKMDVSSSFSLWPPSQRTRDAVINRLVETLSTPSLLSKRYGSVPPEEATASARSIEEEAFNAAGGSSVESPSIDDGIEILQVYSREIGKRMLDVMKSRSFGTNSDVPSEKSPDEATADDIAVVSSEEISSVEKESSD